MSKPALDLYSRKSHALPQKLWLTGIQILLIALVWYILFSDGAFWFTIWPGNPVAENTPARRLILLMFCFVTLCRFVLTFTLFMKRSIPFEELISVPFAFGLYYVGSAVLALPNHTPMGVLDYIGIGLFVTGSWLNSFSEYQRYRFKLASANKGKLFTGGLFGLSIHINFFGDFLWVAGFACVAGHVLGIFIPLMLLLMFMFLIIPPLDTHLRSRYGADFEVWERTNKRLVPYIW